MKAVLSACAILALLSFGGSAMNVDAPPAVVADTYTKVSVLPTWLRTAVKPDVPTCAVTSPSLYTLGQCNTDTETLYFLNATGLYTQPCNGEEPNAAIKPIQVPVDKCYYNGLTIPGGFGVQLNKLL